MPTAADAPPSALSVGTRCYIPDPARVWLPVVIEAVDERAGTATVIVESKRAGESDGPARAERRTITMSAGDVFPLQNIAPPDQYDEYAARGCEDMIHLSHLHEPAILYNLVTRFHARLPYTYTGDICVAVNPYQWIDELYSRDLHAQYLRARSKKQLPPHVYAVAVAAYRHMREEAVNQSILVSGESGAGKTETTKIVMDNLATIASHTDRSSGSESSTIEKILDVNPLLESFGNAKTTRNDNSSRFGKFTQLQFNDKQVLCGAKCETYLLEKTRVVTQEPGERNYHIFYQLLHGATKSEREQFGLEDENQEYAYLQRDKTMLKKDAKNYAKTKHALSLLGLGKAQQDAIFQVVSGILHLGQAQFQANPDNDEASHLVEDSVAYSSILLGLDAAAMSKALCHRTVKVGGEVYAVPLAAEQAQSCRDALAKAIYSNLFDWMVVRINDSLSADDVMVNAIGVLDIFGFESFVHNSYEQLCINYANEKLQQKFTQDVFKAVQDEYVHEEITWDHISYPDNHEVLALIEGKMGILSLLNEEVVRPKGNDEGFVSKLSTNYRQSKKVIEFVRISRTQFSIHHYAESVKYEAIGFLEKHKDALLPDLSELMLSSSEKFLQEIFELKAKQVAVTAAAAAVAAFAKGRPASRRGGSDSAGGTVGMQFKQSLGKLMETINETNVNYIRCIKPNSIKSPTVLDEQMVVKQLRCAGVIEAISIARAGYPNRLTHHSLAAEFDIFLTEQQQQSGDHAKNCLILVKRFRLRTPEEYQMGKTKIYLQKGVLERLEHAKAQKLFAYAASIQSRWRGIQTRRMYAELRAALIVIQFRSKVFVAVQRLRRKKASVALLQRVWRGHQGRQIYFAALCQFKALQIQRCWRGRLGRQRYLRALQQDRARRIQCSVRCYFARKELTQRREAYEAEQRRLRQLERKRQYELELKRQRERALEEERERKRLEEEQRRLEQLRLKSALLLQRCVRGYFGRCLFAEIAQKAHEEKLRIQREQEELERQQRLEEEHRLLCEWGAVVIQKYTRGHLSRCVFAVMLQKAREEQLRLQREQEERERQQRLAEERELERQRKLAEERERQRLLEEEQERERQRQLAEERERQRRLAEEQERERQRQLAEERERQRLLEEERLRQIAEEKERQRLLEEERLRQIELEKERERARRERAAVLLQSVVRGRVARLHVAVLRVEAANDVKAQADWDAANQENLRLKEQLAELLEANVELESLVSEWNCEKDVLEASTNLRELELTQQINSKRKILEATRREYDELYEQTEHQHSMTSSGPTEAESVANSSSASDSEEEDDVVGDPKDYDRSSMISTTPSYFDNDRPSADVAQLLKGKSRFKISKPKLGNVMSAGASSLGRAKKWLPSRNGKSTPRN